MSPRNLRTMVGGSLPRVPEVFSRVRRGASSGCQKKPLVQSVLIYHARWTLTLSLICQSNRHYKSNFQREERCAPAQRVTLSLDKQAGVLKKIIIAQRAILTESQCSSP